MLMRNSRDDFVSDMHWVVQSEVKVPVSVWASLIDVQCAINLAA